MKSNKKTLSTVGVSALLLIIFVLVTTVIPFEKGVGSWVAFVFGIVSIIASCCITLFAFAKGDSLTSKLYGFHVFRVGVIYLVAQLVVCLIIYAVGAFVEVPAWVSIILGVVLLALCLAGVLIVDNTRDVIEEVEKKTQEQIKVMKTFNLSVGFLKALCQDEAISDKLEKLEESFKYSDPVSSEATQPYEDKIKAEIEILTAMLTEKAEGTEAKIRDIEVLLSTRNAICKMSK